MMDIWQQAIKPTLLDYRGCAWVFSTPNGEDPDNFFYCICTDSKHGFTEYHAPTHTNPYLPLDEIQKLEAENHPMVFRQEYLAEFVDWSGAAFFSLDSLLVDGLPVPMPYNTDQIYAVVDTAVKDGLEHDGTAVTYYAKNKIFGHPLTILDYDVVQISGDLLDQWLPNVLARCEELARLTNARQGSLGAWVEDKATGSVLIQASQRRGWPVQAINGPLTASGKDGRAMAVAGYVHNGNVKISEYAFNKTITYKNQTKNHFLTQVCGFRLGNKTPHHMDVLDTFTYGVAIGLGDSLGF
jgi:phage terminase large subunit-like protein